MKFLRSESYKKGILSSIALNIFAKGVAFINSVVIAFYFGAQSKTDIYFYCYVTVGLLVGFISSLDSSVIIPEAIRIREQEGEENTKRFFNFFLYLYLGIGFFLTLILLINPIGIVSAISNFGQGAVQENRNVIVFFLPIFILMLICNYLTNLLSSYRFFTIPIIAAIINSLFSLFFLICFHDSLQVGSLVLGLGVGYLVNIAMLFLLMKKKLNWVFGTKRGAFDKRLKKNIRYALLGNLTSLLSGYAPYFIMSNFNAGAVTMFNYAKNLAEMPNQMVITQFSNVSGIKFNELSARNQSANLNTVFLQSTGFLIFLMTPVCALLFLFSEPIIAFIYKRGAFDITAVKQTAFLLKFLSISLIYFVINTMVSRLFMATQKLKESFWYQVYMNAILLILIFTASAKFGITGYVAATLIYQAIIIILTYWLVKKYFSFIEYGLVLKLTTVNIAVNTVLTAGFYLLLDNITYTYTIVLVGLWAAIYLLLLLLINQALKIDGMAWLFIKQQKNRLGSFLKNSKT